MRRANAPSASASAGDPSTALSAPSLQAASNSAAVFSSQRLQIALDRDVRGVGVLALQQLAGRQRGAGVRERPQLHRVIVARQLGKGPREEQIAGGDRRAAARRGGDRGAPAAQLSAVDEVVVHERRRVHQLDRDGGAREALLALGARRRAARGFGGEDDEQRAQALAAGDDRRICVRGQRRARRGGDALEVKLGARHALAQPRPAAMHDRLEPLDADRCSARSAAHRAHHAHSRATVPAWIATIPPAVIR